MFYVYFTSYSFILILNWKDIGPFLEKTLIFRYNLIVSYYVWRTIMGKILNKFLILFLIIALITSGIAIYGIFLFGGIESLIRYIVMGLMHYTI